MEADPPKIVPFEKLPLEEQLAFLKTKAKRNCNKGCNGNGVVLRMPVGREPVNTSAPKTKRTMNICECVSNRLDRERREAKGIPRNLPMLQGVRK